MAKEFVDRLEMLIEQDKTRRKRAKTRAALPEYQGDLWCLGLLGLNTTCKRFEIQPGVILREVEDPPSTFDLSEILDNPNLIYAIGRYSTAFRYEISINQDIVGHKNAASTAASAIAGLRIRTQCDVLVPAIANHSWSTIIGKEKKSVHGMLFQDIPQAYRFEPDKTVSEEDLQWISDNLSNISKLLRGSIPFTLSADALINHNHAPRPELAAASLWTGIEALFNVQNEIRFRLAMYLAALLEKRGPARVQRYKKIGKLYDARSKIVHGVPVNEEEVIKHILEVRNILSSLLSLIVERGAVFSTEEVEDLLLNSA